MVTQVPHPSPPRPSGAAAGCLGAVLLMGLGGLGLAAQMFGVHVPMTSIVALILVLGAVGSLSALSGQGSAALRATAVLPAAIPILLFAILEDRQPVVRRDGLGHEDYYLIIFMLTPAVLAVCSMAGFVGGLLHAHSHLATAAADGRPKGAMRVAAWAAIQAGFIALAIALPIWVLRPSPERYLTSLPVLGRLEALPASVGNPDCAYRPDIVEQRAEFGAVRVWRRNKCGCGIALANGVVPDDPGLSWMTWYKQDLGPPPYAPCGSLTLRHDAAHRFILVQDDGGNASRAYQYSPEARGPLKEAIDVTRADLADATGPSSWRVLPALIGWAVALAALRRPGPAASHRLALAAALLPGLPLWVALALRLIQQVAW